MNWVLLVWFTFCQVQVQVLPVQSNNAAVQPNNAATDSRILPLMTFHIYQEENTSDISTQLKTLLVKGGYTQLIEVSVNKCQIKIQGGESRQTAKKKSLNHKCPSIEFLDSSGKAFGEIIGRHSNAVLGNTIDILIRQVRGSTVVVKQGRFKVEKLKDKQMLWKEHALRKAVTKEISPFLHEQEKNNVAAFLQDKQPIEKAILSTTKQQSTQSTNLLDVVSHEASKVYSVEQKVSVPPLTTSTLPIVPTTQREELKAQQKQVIVKQSGAKDRLPYNYKQFTDIESAEDDSSSRRVPQRMRIIPRIPPNQELPISRLAPLPSLKNPSPSPRRFQKPHLRDKTETESQESDNEGTINNFEKKNTFAKKQNLQILSNGNLATKTPSYQENTPDEVNSQNRKTTEKGKLNKWPSKDSITANTPIINKNNESSETIQAKPTNTVGQQRQHEGTPPVQPEQQASAKWHIMFGLLLVFLVLGMKYLLNKQEEFLQKHPHMTAIDMYDREEEPKG